MKKLKIASAFTGICGLEKGFPEEAAEMTHSIEWDKNRQKVINYHYPNVTQLFGDIREVNGSDIGRPDVLAGGFPCRGVSIAAPDRHSKGLLRGESALYYEFIRLAEEVLRLVEYTQPRWVLMENVDGLLTNRGGADFTAVKDGLLQLGYGFAWRVVDARYLPTDERRSPQKRRRVLMVGHLGGDPRPAGEVLGIWGPGSEADGQGDGWLEDTGPGANTFTLGGDLVRVWRKSSNSQVSIRFHDHPTCPPPRPNGKYPEHDCHGTFNPAYRETWYTDGHCNTLARTDSGNALRQKHLVSQGGRLRTLTPVEWERAQGFPDNWTAMIPESARMPALGDAIHVGTSNWWGRRLLSVHESLPQLRTA